MKKIKIAIIGYGNRGCIYSSFIQSKRDMFEVVAVVEFIKAKQLKAQNDLNLQDNQLFTEADDFFNTRPDVDLLIVASMDKYHFKHASQAINLGMNVLLEKPISLSIEECRSLKKLSKEKQRFIVVCHVLRYTSFYNIIKEIIDSKEIGNVYDIHQCENVAYWHQAHSYTRGNWRNSNETGPMILAKCSHDFDIIYWLLSKKCISVSSFGSLKFFKKENQPKEASNRCFECKINETCPYNCFKFYLGRGREWARQLVGDDLSDVNITNYLKQSPYGRCVFACDNNVVDHQIVNMLFEDNVTATLTMNAYTNDCYREIHVYGTHGEIIGDFEKRIIKINNFINGSRVIDLNAITDDFSGHGGGDQIMFFEVCDLLLNGTKTDRLSLIQDSILSHKMAFSAEKSRLNNGEPTMIE